MMLMASINVSDGPASGGGYHLPVMSGQVMDQLAVCPGGTYCDGTLGGGGHAGEILRRSAPDGRLLGIDRDPEALAECGRSLSEHGQRLRAVRGSFDGLVEIAREQEMLPLDGVLVDLGVSSHQLDSAPRGFSFDRDGPLDMRMGPDGQTAAELIAASSPDELADIIFQFGEERKSRRVARAIKAAEARGELSGTKALAQVVARVVGKEGKGRGKGKGKGKWKHPATRTFQALRIAVNDEMGALRRFLERVPSALRSGGRVAVITFHSLEDRAVKRAFAAMASPCTCPPDLPVCVCGLQPTAKILTPRPLLPTEEEVACNPRARSAKLRAAEML